MRIKCFILTIYPEYSESKYRYDTMTPVKNLLSSLMPTEFFNGIIGTNIDMIPTEKKDIFLLNYKNLFKFYHRSQTLNKKSLTLPVIGCSWSHQLLYEKLLLDNDSDCYLILEDDVVLASLHRLEKLITSDVKNVDVIHLGESEWHPFLKTTNHTELLYNIDRNYFNNAMSYIVFKSGAKKMLRYCNNNIIVPPDDLISNTYLFRDLKFCVPEGPIFYHNIDHYDSLVKHLHNSNYPREDSLHPPDQTR